MRRIVTFGLCALALPMLAAGQTKDDFEFWDQNNNGDLTCSEAEDGPDGGLRLPAYQDDRDGTGIIYEWLERSRSSDADADGIACDSVSNPSGYIPNVQPVDDPSQGCPVDAETWRGLQVCEEQPREGYDRDAFGSAYSSLEDDIIDMLPPTMRADAVLLLGVRHPGGWDCGDGYRAHRRARRSARQRHRGRPAPGHRGRPGQPHDRGSASKPDREERPGRRRVDAGPARRVVCRARHRRQA